MRKWIIILIISVITVVIAYNYIYQDHRDIETENAEYSIKSEELMILFSRNASEAEQKFLNKTIEISGLISEINANDITMNNNIFCQFSNDINLTLEKNKSIKIKGRVIGYDDLLEQVKLDQCSLLKY
jgi:thioredoxin-related protein